MPTLDISAGVSDNLEIPFPLEEVERVATWVLEAEGVPVAELSIALVSDSEIAALNREYLSHEGPTDVLSFPLHLPGGTPLGDVYIGLEQARRQALESGVTEREEVLRLVVHGTLHALGYEHPEGAERERSPMYLRQEQLLSSYLSGGGHA